MRGVGRSSLVYIFKLFLIASNQVFFGLPRFLLLEVGRHSSLDMFYPPTYVAKPS